ncbi:MAG: ribulose-phosphate 3-epimerase [Myxococcales bacterium]|nr:ribulose-phosphate 3-epimerase [Myxococcales bacterium]
MTIKIAPSILAADFGRLAEEVKAVCAAGADYIHVDVMDGRYVPNISIGQPVVRAIKRASDVPLDVHLMIEEPERYLESFAESGADILTVHVEASVHLHRTLTAIRALGMRAGVTLNPGTPVGALEAVLDEVDMVLVMSVNPGFGGQTFIARTLERVRTVREMTRARGLSIDIEVDGGVVVENAGEIAAAGANVFVSGTGIFRTPDYAQTIAAMRAAAERAATTTTQ